MKKEIWLIIILGIVIIALAGISLWPSSKPANNKPPVTTEGIQITSPKANEEISLPIKITGVVNGNGWVGFEGQVGHVDLVSVSDGLTVGSAFLKATSEWTTLPVTFEADVSDQLECVVAPCNWSGNANLVFHNENPSGLPEKDKTFTLPVKVSTVSAETTIGMTKVEVYFNSATDFTCGDTVFAANREVPKTEAIARVALEELLKGPTQQEKNEMLATSINLGVKIQSLTIENGVAKVDFDEQLEKGVAGSCRVSAIRAQIIKTLEQFPTIKNVIISINGRTADILQP